MQRTLKVLAALLSYPSEELMASVPELTSAVRLEQALPRSIEVALLRFLASLGAADLFDAQERYVLLFDRTRSLSLHLFEHVHGESRERGSAMVDLAELYRRYGLEIDEHELPDFLPLFLEFLSEIPASEARKHLASPLHIIEVLRLRLEKRNSDYAHVFAAIAALAQSEPQADAVRELLSEAEVDADDLEALDKAWQDEPVVFGPGAAANDGCPKVAGMLDRMRLPEADAHTQR